MIGLITTLFYSISFSSSSIPNWVHAAQCPAKRVVLGACNVMQRMCVKAPEGVTYLYNTMTVAELIGWTKHNLVETEAVPRVRVAW